MSFLLRRAAAAVPLVLIAAPAVAGETPRIDSGYTVWMAAGYSMAFTIGGLAQLKVQAIAVAATLTYTAIVILLVVSAVFGLRVTREEEREGLDVVLHGEQLG